MSPLISILIDLDCTKNKNINNGGVKSIGNISNGIRHKKFMIKEEFVINERLETEKKIEMNN